MADSKEHKYFNNGQKFSTPISELNKIIQNSHVLIMPDQLMEILLQDSAQPSLPRETQPHVDGMRTPPFLMFLEVFLRVDWSTKVVCCDPLDTCERLVCVYVCVCVAARSFISGISNFCENGWIK